jgi:serine/threonine kinase 32
LIVLIILVRVQAIDFDGEVNLFHFFLLRSVGKGAFGKVRSSSSTKDGKRSLMKGISGAQVRVVQHKQTKTLYALKYINKQKCVKMKAVANIVQERRLLEEVSRTSL